MAKKHTPVETTKKAHSQPGKYVYKAINSVIMDCSCGGKFVKTRRGQTTCVQCINEAA